MREVPTMVNCGLNQRCLNRVYIYTCGNTWQIKAVKLLMKLKRCKIAQNTLGNVSWSHITRKKAAIRLTIIKSRASLLKIHKTLYGVRANESAIMHCDNFDCIRSRLNNVHFHYFVELNATTKTQATNAKHRATYVLMKGPSRIYYCMQSSHHNT